MKDLKPDRIAQFLHLWKERNQTQTFVKDVYIPDLLAVAAHYKDWGTIGGTSNFLVWGDLPQGDSEPESHFMPRGVIMKRDLKGVKMAKQEKVTEHITHGWYEDGVEKHPFEGETKPRHGDYDTGGKYTWFKAPRYDAEPCEVGPLARLLVAYAKGMPEVKKSIDDTLKTLDIGQEALFPTLGRTATRGLETVIIGDAMEGWIMELVENIKKGDLKTYQPWEMPDQGMGCGLNDVARGALGHWVKIEDKKIKNYHYVVPSTWNLGPRCFRGKRDPVEESLVGTPVKDPKRPLEILRTVHSFDPCIA